MNLMSEALLDNFQPPRDPHSRAYRHEACGGDTLVSGDDYVLLECPFRPVDATFCCTCEQMVPLESVSWVDSGQNVAQYRRQVHDSVPFLRRVYLSLLGNAYEGAVNLNLDSSGTPRQPTA
jgi:hypothetical protein